MSDKSNSKRYDYEEWLRDTKEVTSAEYSEARAQVFDVLCEAEKMLLSRDRSFKSADVVGLTAIIQQRINTLESRRDLADRSA